MRSDSDPVDHAVSTGSLPGWDDVERLVAGAHAREREREHGEGVVADYIATLAHVDPALFGICVAEVDGAVHDAGDATHPFSIQSISKAFVYALVCDVLGHQAVRERVGVNNTGLP